jgi:hypothetical protein
MLIVDVICVVTAILLLRGSFNELKAKTKISDGTLSAIMKIQIEFLYKISPTEYREAFF